MRQVKWEGFALVPQLYIYAYDSIQRKACVGHKRNALPALASMYSVDAYRASTKADDCSCINSEEEMQR